MRQVNTWFQGGPTSHTLSWALISGRKLSATWAPKIRQVLSGSSGILTDSYLLLGSLKYEQPLCCRFYRLDVNARIHDCVKNRIIIENPVLYVALKDQGSEYNTEVNTYPPVQGGVKVQDSSPGIPEKPLTPCCVLL